MQTMSEYNRWLNGYGFWRGQYTVRNQEYIAGRNELKKLSDVFLQMGHVSYQRWMYLEWGAAIGKPEPPQHDTWGFLPEQLELVFEYRNKAAQFRASFPYGQDTSRIPMSHVFKLFEQEKFPPEGSVYFKSSSGEIMFGVNASDIVNNPRPNVIHGALSDTVQVVKENESHITLKIEYHAELYELLDKIRYFIEAARRKEEFDAVYKFCADTLDDWRSGKPLDDTPLPQLPRITSDLDLVKKSKLEIVRHAKHVGYKTDGDVRRALGLWLYDYKAEHGGSALAALDVLLEQIHTEPYHPYHDKLAEREPSKALSHATRCIAKAEVLKIKND